MSGPGIARLAVIGAGRWGRCYIKTIARESTAELRYVVSRSAETQEIVPPSCDVVGAWQELFQRRDLDGVIVATPPHTHFEIAAAAIERRLPVLIEKPLTLDPDEAAVLHEKAVSHHVPVLVGHVHLYSPAFNRLKQELADMGAIRCIRAQGANSGPIRTDTPAMWDYAPHDLAMCLDIVGSSPVDVRALVQESVEVPEGHGESVRIDLVFAKGISAAIQVSNIASRKIRLFEVETDDGIVVYDDTSHEKLVRLHSDGTSNQQLDVSAELPLTRLVREFAACVRDRQPRPQAIEVGREVVNILGRCQCQVTGQTRP